jgi:membrane protein
MAIPKPESKYPSKSIWNLGGLTPGALANHVAGEIRANNILGRASELAFDFLFALFPLILFMFNLFGLFTSRSSELLNDFLSFFGNFLPLAAYQLLRETTIELATNSTGGMLTIEIVTALWFASGGVNSMISALNMANQIREARSWVRVRMIALGLTLAIAILLLAALLFVLVSGHAVDWLGGKLQLRPVVVFLWKAFQLPAAVFFILVSNSLIFYFGPDLRERRWRWFSPGAAFGAFLWLAASLGFRIYLHFYDSYTLSYGSLGGIMILLAWLYVTGLAFLIGGEINAVIDREIAKASDQPDRM